MNERPGRVYLPWSKEEDERLSRAFESGTPLNTLSETHQRSLGAIKSRLLHLGYTPRPRRTPVQV